MIHSSTPTPSAYAQSGVSIDEGNRAVELMKSAVKSTYTSDVLAGIGAFGGMLQLSAAKHMTQPVLVASTDGAGTKTMVAQTLQRWDTIGADLVNHSINDVLVQGASPLFFMDYVATAKLDAATTATIVAGMAKACVENQCVLLGGETAEMPGVYHAGHWDIAGTIVGLVDRAQAIDGSQIQAGDLVLGLPSTGLHTNGYSLARKVLSDLDWQVSIQSLLEQGQLNGLVLNDAELQIANASIGDLLLAVHRPYLKELQALWDAQLQTTGLVHITGGGFVENIPRVLPSHLSATIDTHAITVPLIFKLIAHLGQVPLDEMYRVFNMGVGMVVLVRPKQLNPIQSVLTEVMGHDAMLLGSVQMRGTNAPAVQLQGLSA